MSRKLSGAELAYSTPDQELLAIGESFRTWRRFLAYPACTVDVKTDHLNHMHLIEKSIVTIRQANILHRLSGFDFRITHVAGTKNPADPLSRYPPFDDMGEREGVRRAGLPEFLARFETETEGPPL